MAELIFFAVVAGLALVALFLLVHHFLPFFLNLRNSPKGSFGWPLVGETLGFLKPHASNALGCFLEDHILRHGKVFTSHLFGSPTVVSCCQELNHFILHNEEKLFQCSYPKPIHGILGKSSMLVVVGETHKRLRKLALAMVNTTKTRPGYINDVEKIAIHLLNSWKGKRNIMFCEEARKFTFSVIVKHVLGLSVDDPLSTKILDDFLTFMKGLISFPLYIPGTPYARAVQARERISLNVKAIVEGRRNRANSHKKGDFLEVLLATSDLSMDEKVSFVLDFLLGGYETTSVLISMVVYFLGQCPSALEQLKREHLGIRANRKEEPLTFEEYKQMKFTQNVVNETLRCGNVVKFVHRKALKDIKFKGYVIPSGWKILPVFSAVHLDSSRYDDASQFNPWRWEGQNLAPCQKFSPFGGGPRLCPGSELARVETALFLHHMVLNYCWNAEDEREAPIAYPYVEFQRGLPLTINPIETQLSF